MTTQSSNLFLSLSRWASAHPENFLTESLARVLEMMRDQAPDLFAEFVAMLTGGGVRRLSTEAVAATSITTQFQADSGSYPDLVCVGPGFAVWVEVKDLSPMDPDQLVRYSRLLGERETEQRSLVLISRTVQPLPNAPYLTGQLTWTQIADWIERVGRNGHAPNTPLVHHFIREFHGFLRSKGMTVDRVDWNLVPGARALVNLRSMLSETLQALFSGTIGAAHGHNYNGWNLRGGENRQAICFLLLYFDEPHLLRLLVHERYLPESERDDWAKHDRTLYRAELDLNDEDVHFFALSIESQRRCIRTFVEERLRRTSIPLRREGEALARIEPAADADVVAGGSA